LDDLIVTLVAEVGDLLQKLSFSFGYYKVWRQGFWTKGAI
jgi:hypothetical protein